MIYIYDIDHNIYYYFIIINKDFFSTLETLTTVTLLMSPLRAVRSYTAYIYISNIQRSINLGLLYPNRINYEFTYSGRFV